MIDDAATLRAAHEVVIRAAQVSHEQAWDSVIALNESGMLAAPEPHDSGPHASGGERG